MEIEITNNFGYRATAVGLACILLFSAAGCNGYLQAVSDDLRDTVKIKVGVGLGLYADAKVTSFLNPGIGWGGYWLNAGFENRYTDFFHPSINGDPFPIGAIPGMIPEQPYSTLLCMGNVRLGVWRNHEENISITGKLFDFEAIGKWDAYGIEKRSEHILFNETSYTEQPLGLELGVGLLVVNGRVGFDPVEFVDLIATIFGWDLLKDNREDGAQSRL